MSCDPVDADVAIVGYGPVGQTLSALLARHGHRVCVVERYAHLYPLPRAFRFDGEVMRIFQRLGVVDELRHDLGEADHGLKALKKAVDLKPAGAGARVGLGLGWAF